ncbi:MAG TPA: hypothetical protein VFC30_03840 [Solirubrobacteraceae bacterium]|nr:hypothetical protein [Solirubrobacteraceae bacterium]
MDGDRQRPSCRPPTLVPAGAYGLHLPDLVDAADLLVEAPEQWMKWQIVLATGSGSPTEFVERSRARTCSVPTGWVDIDLSTRTSTMHFPQEPPHAHIVHPFLGSTAVVVAHWRGLQSFHAGAFVTDHGAWAILGYKGAGKSSMLAALSSMGVPILTDDVLVIGEEMQGFAGPRCIDLRSETASMLSLGADLGVVGGRERWRLQLDPIAVELPLAGWICLDWGEPAILAVPAHERISALYQSIALRVEQHDPGMLARLMDLLALPMVRVRRPRSIATLNETATAVLSHVEHLRY